MDLGDAILRDLILDIYDTALEPQKWPEVLSKISRILRANGTFIFELDQSGGDRKIRAPYFSETYTSEAVNAYLAAHNDQEIEDQDKFAFYSKKTDGIDLIGDEVLANSEEELLARANTQQLLGFGIRYRAGALLNKDNTSIDRFAVQFSEQHGPISPAERKIMRILLPHVAKALNINRPTIQLAAKYNNVVASLDLLRIGVCIVMPYGEIVYKNYEFDRQLSEFDVFRIDPRGRLVFSAQNCESGVVAYFRDLFINGRYGARPWKEAIVADSKNEDRCLCLEVSPLTRPNDIVESQQGAHLIYSLDTTLPFNIDAPAIAEHFDLTSTEQEVLDLLAEGATNAEIAKRRDKSIETINSQVKSILSKTGTQNRAKLIRLAANMSFGMLQPQNSLDSLGFFRLDGSFDRFHQNG